jgi:hypothetical protein
MKHSWKINAMAFAVASVVAVAGSAAFAARPPGAGSGGGGGGGGGGEETAAQNLSVPAILVGQLGALVCGTSADSPTGLLPPMGTPLSGYEVPGYYWVQKVHTWQAQCFNAEDAWVYGNWGDNITGDAKLSTGSPIRVELVLTNRDDFSSSGSSEIPSGTLQGYNVIKLETSLADRLSAWGHLANLDDLDNTDPTDDVWLGNPINFGQADWVVHDAGMMISVCTLVNGVPTTTCPVPLQAIGPEINASGKVVYGYNLRVTAAGEYRIQFYAPNVTITGTDAPTDQGFNDENNAYLDIVVSSKAGGGKKGGGKP